MADHKRPPELKDVLARLAAYDMKLEQHWRWLSCLSKQILRLTQEQEIEKPDCPAGRECARVRGVREWDRDG